MSSAAGMNATIKFNRQQKGDRKTMYDRDGIIKKGTYGEMDDHKEMKGHVYAAFQKEQFAKRKKEHRKQIRIRILVVIITFVIVMSFLQLWEIVDFYSITPQFQ